MFQQLNHVLEKLHHDAVRNKLLLDACLPLTAIIFVCVNYTLGSERDILNVQFMSFVYTPLTAFIFVYIN
jgi:hypothetical protein